MSTDNKALTSGDISYTWTDSVKTKFVLHFDGTGIVRGFVGLGRRSFSIEDPDKGILTFRRMVDAKARAAQLWPEGHRVSFSGGKPVVVSRPALVRERQARTQVSSTESGAFESEGTFLPRAFQYLHKDGEYAKRLGKTKDLVSHINRVKRDVLREEFMKLMNCAPHRSDRGKRYFVNGHDGIPSGTSVSNRYEEHLAIALWNLKQFWPRDDGSQFCLLDYQVPLQARQSDRGIGKVDLVGLTTEKRLMVIELKVNPEGTDNRGDTPAAALLQGLRYAAIVQANRKTIGEEIRDRCKITVSDQPPIVQVLAPQDWWQGWMQLPDSTRNAAGWWEPAFTKLAREIEDLIGVTVECASLNIERRQLSFGGSGRPPRLGRTPELTYLFNGIR